MHAHHEVPVVDRHVPDRGIAHDAGVVHHDVELAEAVDRLLHELATLVVVADVAVVRHRLATRVDDELDRVVGGLARARAALAAAEVVDDDLGAQPGHLHGVTAADAVARAGDDRYLAVEQPHGSPCVSRVRVSDESSGGGLYIPPREHPHWPTRRAARDGPG